MRKEKTALISLARALGEITTAQRLLAAGRSFIFRVSHLKPEERGISGRGLRMIAAGVLAVKVR